VNHVEGLSDLTPTFRLNAFMHAASKRLEHDESAIAQAVSRALANENVTPPDLPPAQMPASAVLPEMLGGTSNELETLLAACATDLHWRHAGFGKLPDDALSKLAVTELIGPDGMFRNPEVRIGLLIQREGFHYPWHRHAAQEVYLVLKGTALWAVDGLRPSPRAPGSVILHASHQPHTMVTLQEPICALWGWVGDIAGSSYSV
jgi:dimethylpropiothetin dethiomethylase